MLKTFPYLFRNSDVRVISLTVRSRNHLESNVSKRLTIAFFVNATGEKAIEPLLVGRNENPCCFKNNESLSRPHGIYYYSNPEAWMTTEIMTSILGKIN